MQHEWLRHKADAAGALRQWALRVGAVAASGEGASATAAPTEAAGVAAALALNQGVRARHVDVAAVQKTLRAVPGLDWDVAPLPRHTSTLSRSLLLKPSTNTQSTPSYNSAMR